MFIDFQQTLRQKVIGLPVLTAIIAISIGILIAFFEFDFFIALLIIVAILICFVSPPTAVLTLFVLQSIVFNRTNEIDAFKLFYFGYYVILIIGWIVYLLSHQSNKTHFLKLFRYSYTPLPLILFLLSLLATSLWLLIKPDYVLWLREFSLYTGYVITFIVATTIFTERGVKLYLFFLWLISLLILIIGSIGELPISIQFSVNGQTNIIMVCLIGFSLFMVSKNILLRIIYLVSVIIAPLTWLQPSFFAEEANELSFVFALTIGILVLAFIIYKKNYHNKSIIIKVVSILALISLFFVTLFGFPIKALDLTDLTYTHRGVSFEILNPKTILDLPTMAIRLKELTVLPKYFYKSPIWGLGITFGIPKNELYDAYGNVPEYFTGYLHNGYASTLLRIGIVGLFLFLWFLFSLLKDGKKILNLSNDRYEWINVYYILGAMQIAFIVCLMVYSILASKFDDRSANTYVGILSGLTIVGLRLLSGDIKN